MTYLEYESVFEQIVFAMRNFSWLATRRRSRVIALTMRVIAVRLWTLALVKVIVLLMVCNWMLIHSHSLFNYLGLHANCRTKRGTRLNVQDRVFLHIWTLWRPGVLRNFLMLRNWTASVVNSWRKHNRLLKIWFGLLLLLCGWRHHTPALAWLNTVRHICRLGISGGVLELLVLTWFLSLNLIYLSVLGSSVRNFQICSSHVCSPTIDMTDLHFCNQQVGDFFIVVSYKAEPSTSFG